MKKDVFISYRSTEVDIAYRVKGLLERNGVSCWMAPESIPEGSNYLLEIPKGIDDCKVFILLLSNGAQESPWVEREVSSAVGRRKNIIPFVIEKCDVSKHFGFLLDVVQRWDAYDELTENLDKLVEKIKILVVEEECHSEKRIVRKTVYSSSCEMLYDKYKESGCEEDREGLIDLANKGDIGAQCRIGDIYAYGMGCNVDYVQAFQWYGLAAENGSAEANSKLGHLYQCGYGVERDYNKAIQLYELSVECEEAYATYYLAEMYEYGYGVKRNLIRAIELYEKAYQGLYELYTNKDWVAAKIAIDIKDKGYYKEDCFAKNDETKTDYVNISYKMKNNKCNMSAEEKYVLAECLKKMDFIRDREDMIRWYNQAAEANHAAAQFAVGELYDLGRYGVSKDYAKAFEWYIRAAEQGDADAQNRLGYMYFEGIYVEQDYSKAVEWFEMGTKRILAEVQLEIADMYFYGKHLARSYNKACEWYAEAIDSLEFRASKGYVDSQYLLGKMYQEGRGVQRDYKKAFHWFEKAAKHEHSDAQYELGNMYHNGFAVQKSCKDSLYWYTKAAEKGNKKAEYMLGKLREGKDYYWKIRYKNADGRIGDIEEYREKASLGDTNAMFVLAEVLSDAHQYEEAFVQYELAAQQGDERAQYELAEAYYFGYGVMKNEKKAYQWYERAALLGYAPAQYKLGAKYKGGTIVDEEDIEALSWLKKAAYQGDENALVELAKIYYHGSGQFVDYKKAFQYYLLLAKVNIDLFLKEADNDFLLYEIPKLTLAYMYYTGLYVEEDKKKAYGLFLKNIVEAIKWYNRKRREQKLLNVNELDRRSVDEKAEEEYLFLEFADFKTSMKGLRDLAKQGSEKACIYLAQIYAQGKGVRRNEKELMKWYRRAAELGSPEGMEMVSWFYRWKLRDEKKGVHWNKLAYQQYEKRAELGDEKAFYELAQFNEYGWALWL